MVRRSHAGRLTARPAIRARWTNSSSTWSTRSILGGTYALLGIGLTLIFGIMRVVNFTHGELYAFGAYFVYFVAVMRLGSNFFLALLSRSSRACLLGALIEVVLLRPDARGRHRHHHAGDDRRHGS